MDLRVSEIVSHWGLADSVVYPLVWLLTQIGGAGHDPRRPGRAGRLPRLAPAHLAAAASGSWLALALLTLAVYAVKEGTGRTAPAFPGSFFFHSDGASFPSGHVANAVLMWGVARWQAVEYGLPARVQRHVLVARASSVRW